MADATAPKPVIRIAGIWLFVLAILFLAILAVVNAYLRPAPELERHSLLGRMLLRTAEVIGVYLFSIAIGLGLSFALSAVRRELKSGNTTAFWLRAIAIALVPMAIAVASSWNAASRNLADSAITATTVFGSLAIDRPPSDGFSFRVFQVARDQPSCGDKNSSLWASIQSSCQSCTLRISECTASLPRMHEHVFSDKSGAYPYVAYPGARIIYIGPDKFLLRKQCESAVRALRSGGTDARCVPDAT